MGCLEGTNKHTRYIKHLILHQPSNLRIIHVLHIPIISVIVIYLVIIYFTTFTHTSLINFRKVNDWGVCKEQIVVKIQAFYNSFLIYYSILKHPTNFLPHVIEPNRVRTSITSLMLCLIIAFCSITCMHKHI